ncbi:hypothetical protein LCGC14_2800660, partial [marine sediment metagenome]
MNPESTILIGDVRKKLAELPEASVQCCVTSPPYWSLRDYGTATWEGGDTACDHRESRAFVNPKNTLGPTGHLPASNAANKMHQKQYRNATRHLKVARKSETEAIRKSASQWLILVDRDAQALREAQAEEI